MLPRRKGSLKTLTGYKYISELEPSAWPVLEPSKFHTGQSGLKIKMTSVNLKTNFSCQLNSKTGKCYFDGKKKKKKCKRVISAVEYVRWMIQDFSNVKLYKQF